LEFKISYNVLVKKIGYFLFTLILFFSFFTKQVSADSNFSTDYNVTYTINQNAITHVDINANLTNLSTNYYASSYSVAVGFKDVENITAHDAGGAITPKITQTDQGTNIELNFNTRTVGYNVKQNFDIRFDTSEVAQNFNHVWDINIPGIANQADFSSFNVSVIYPSFLGNPAYIKPAPSGINVQNGNQLDFTKQDLGSSGISISFGNFQIYNFNLTYHLANPNYFPISTEIALPPATNYQDVEIDNINQKPTNVKLDSDGNWLAEYSLAPYKKLDVKVSGKVKVYLNPQLEDLSSNQLTEDLQSQTYWESDNPKIAGLAKTLKTPYAIYQYVVKTLNYDYNRVQANSPRLGALQVLNNPNSAVCLEFSDLFIALSRAAGIPAREVEGYGYSNNSRERPLSLVEDVLHAWPEYYDFDKKAWVMVDPTWGNTTSGVDYFNTLDFDHIAFVIQGAASNYPIPAGGYKLLTGKNTKDIDMQIGSTFTQNAPILNASLEIPDTLIAGLPTDGFIKITNSGRDFIQAQTVLASTNYLEPSNQSFTVKDIPPYGFVSIPISFFKTPFLTNRTDTVKITAGNNTFNKNIRILPFFVNKLVILGGIIFVSLCIIISLVALVLRRLSLFRQRRKNNLRGES
jgi:transglutaminase-like putative cysteine protease